MGARSRALAPSRKSLSSYFDFTIPDMIILIIVVMMVMVVSRLQAFGFQAPPRIPSCFKRRGFMVSRGFGAWVGVGFGVLGDLQDDPGVLPT